MLKNIKILLLVLAGGTAVLSYTLFVEPDHTSDTFSDIIFIDGKAAGTTLSNQKQSELPTYKGSSTNTDYAAPLGTSMPTMAFRSTNRAVNPVSTPQETFYNSEANYTTVKRENKNVSTQGGRTAASAYSIGVQSAATGKSTSSSTSTQISNYRLGNLFAAEGYIEIPTDINTPTGYNTVPPLNTQIAKDPISTDVSIGSALLLFVFVIAYVIYLFLKRKSHTRLLHKKSLLSDRVHDKNFEYI